MIVAVLKVAQRTLVAFRRRGYITYVRHQLTDYDYHLPDFW